MASRHKAAAKTVVAECEGDSRKGRNRKDNQDGYRYLLLGSHNRLL
jgi:hypothetical protein